jgi:hypothetical protein
MEGAIRSQITNHSRPEMIISLSCTTREEEVVKDSRIKVGTLVEYLPYQHIRHTYL